MSAVVYVHGGETDPYHDGEEGLHSYAVTDTGVLRIFTMQPGGQWSIRFEYSPSGWTKVEGTRYLGTQLAQMSGADGSTKTMAEALRSSTS